MDHGTPGQRQFISEEQYRIYYQGKFGLSDKEMAAFMLERKRDQKRYGDAHRRYVVTNIKNKTSAWPAMTTQRKRMSMKQSPSGIADR